MTLLVNGETRAISSGDVAELVVELGLPPAAALVEHNGTALHRHEWPARILKEGDRIEVVRIVAGG